MAPRTTNTSKTSPKQLSAKEKAIKALDYRKQGWAFREIAAKLGYKTESGARNAVNRLLAKTEFEAVADYRKLTLLQLDELYQQVYKQRNSGDGKLNLWAVDRLQAIIDQKARLLGLYSATQIEVYDWRKEFQEAGLDGDELADQLFEKALEAYNKQKSK
jgi:hypothetical protein